MAEDAWDAWNGRDAERVALAYTSVLVKRSIWLNAMRRAMPFHRCAIDGAVVVPADDSVRRRGLLTTQPIGNEHPGQRSAQGDHAGAEEHGNPESGGEDLGI